jgi:hypothetical protein
MLKMKGCRNAPAGFATSVCLVPVNVTNVECNYVCVCVCVYVYLCICVCWVGGCIMYACIREYYVNIVSVGKVTQGQ